MGEDKPPTPPTTPAPPRRRTIPLITSIIVTCLVVACAVEGFFIYLQRFQIESISTDATSAGDKITELERELRQVNYTFESYLKVLGHGDLAELEELTKDARPPTVRGYVGELEAKLQRATTKLDELQKGWDDMVASRDAALRAQATAEGELTRKAEEFRQTAERLAGQLEAEQAAHRQDVEGLRAELAKKENEIARLRSESDENAELYNQERLARRRAETYYLEQLDKVRLLLAEALGVTPQSVDLNPAILAFDELRTTVQEARPTHVSLAFPQGGRLEAGMVFIIYNRQGRRKALVQLDNVEADKALGQVLARYVEEAVKAGDMAELHLGYEALRTPPARPPVP